MGRHDDLDQTMLARGEKRLHVVFEHSLEGLSRRPLRVIRSEGLDPVDGKEQLEVERLLGPQGAVVVEGGDALGLRHEVRICRIGDSGNEVEDRSLASPSFQEGSGSVVAAG